MKRVVFDGIAAALFCAGWSAGASAQQRLDVPMKPDLVSVKVRVGLKDQQPTTWEGSYRLTEGRIVATDGWRFAGDDYATRERFRLEVRRNFPLFWRLRGRDPKALATWPNGFVLTLEGAAPSSRLEIKTARGDVSIPLGKPEGPGGLPYGQVRMFLDGSVEAERVPTARLIVQSPTEDYWPAAAGGPDGAIAVAYVAFTHGEGYRSRGPLNAEPKDLSVLAVPAGGDQLMFTELKNARWTPPRPLTPKGGDLFRPAVAVDGQGRVWVFWSANVQGNWDLYARVRTGGTWGEAVRATTAPGADINAAAATDGEGRVWLAWQGFGRDNSDIFAARQEGGTLGKAERVADGPANEWTPAIAASADGQVAVAWDTYQRGDYDVHVRRWHGGAWKPPRAVAATERNECRASVAFDKRNRLWIAYESSPEGWGKDWGPYDQSPRRTPLYRQREVGVKVLAGGKLLAPPGNVNHALPTPQGTRRWPKSPRQAVLAAGPRLAVDALGRVWLSARIRMAKYISGAGTSWTNFLTTCEAGGWRPAVIVPCSEGLLHETPALLPAPGGGITIIATCDGRLRNSAFFGSATPRLRRRSRDAPPATTRTYARYPDPWVNWEIAAAETGRLGPPAEPKLTAAASGQPPEASPEARAEAAHVAAMRKYRAAIGGKTLRILRGEFHRHTEISADGGGDGTLFDMWRYGLDIAALDWLGFGDHDNGGGREFTWWLSQKTTDVFLVPDAFTPMFTYERSVNYPDGHRNAVFARRGVRTLPRLRGGMGKAMDDLPPDAARPHSGDTQLFYKYLRRFDGVCASHTSGTNMGTDWRDNDPKVEPVVEIYQGCRQSYERPGAPRSNTPDYSLGEWRPLGFVSRALLMGYRLGFQSSSDHVSTHMSYCNVWVEHPTRQAVLEAMKRRCVYGATDNILADVRCGEHFMGEELTVGQRPRLRVKLIGTAPFARVVIVKDNQYVYSAEPNKPTVELEWTDLDAKPGKTSYYYVRGEQVGQEFKRKVRSPGGKPVEVTINNGELVWVSPLWITYKP